MSDLIDRQAAIDYCNKLIDVERKQGTDEMNYGQERVLQTEAIIAYLETLPPAQSNIARDIATIIENEKDMRVLLNAQPRMKGEWIDNETSYADGVRQSCNCSMCGKRSIRPLGDFCRWCGADMRGEE